jgi:MFS family permease
MPLYAKSLFHLKPTYELVISKVLFSLGHAVAVVGIPLYFLQLGLSDAQIGIFTGLISLLIAVLSLYLPPVLEKFNQRKLLISSAFLASTSFIMFGFAETVTISIFLLAFSQIWLHVNSSALIVLFKDSTRSKEEFTKDTGFLGSFNNLGWFIGPLLGGLTLNAAGFKGVFILAGFLTLLGGLYVWLFPFKTVIKKRKRLDIKIKDNLKFYLSNVQLRIAYLQKFGVDLWWGFIWIFIPIFMLKEGYSGASIGLFLALTQLPLFLFEYKTVGSVAKYGFRKIFIASYVSLALICLLSFFFFDSYSVIALGLILLGSLALSFLEPISDLFFFSKVSLLEEEKAYPIYSTSSPIGSMVSRIIPGLALLIFYDKAVFVIVGFLMCFIAYRAFAVKD